MLKAHNRFTCDLKDGNGNPACDVDFYYDPGAQNQPPQWDEATRTRLSRIVAVVSPLTNYTTFYCSDLHAVEAIGKGQHLPPLPSALTTHATDADVKKVAAAAAKTSGMKVVS